MLSNNYGEFGIYELNKNVFSNYSNLYMRNLGYDFVDNEEYDYYFEYGYYNEDTGKVVYPNMIKSGKITGELLNNMGINIPITNNKNYLNPSYRFYVKKGDEILAYSAPVFHLVDEPTITSIKVTNNGRELYNNNSIYSYYVANKMPLKLNISGIGFESTEKYGFYLAASRMYNSYLPNYDSFGNVGDIYYFTGEELNNGLASIDLNILDDYDASGYAILLEEKKYANGLTYLDNAMFTIKYINLNDYISDAGEYTLDDIGIIKNIKKGTSVNEFNNNISLTDYNTLRIVDNIGQYEVLDKIGTGMQGRIIDKYNNKIINIGLSVKGDITGDGNVSLTDLVKVKGHLIESEILTDVYMMAADVDNNEEVTITDLVRISRDVLGIEELG